MAQSCGKGVGRVELRQQRLLGYGEHTHKHGPHLLLRRRARAGDGQLDGTRLILGDGHLAGKRRSHRHALGAPELEHRLHVLTEEWRLDSKLVGHILRAQVGHALVDAAQTHIVRLKFAEPHHPHGHHHRLARTHAQYAVPHHVGAGVDTENHALAVAHVGGRRFHASTSSVVGKNTARSPHGVGKEAAAVVGIPQLDVAGRLGIHMHGQRYRARLAAAGHTQQRRALHQRVGPGGALGNEYSGKPLGELALYGRVGGKSDIIQVH